MNLFQRVLKGVCHEDIAVLGESYAVYLPLHHSIEDLPYPPKMNITAEKWKPNHIEV